MMQDRHVDWSLTALLAWVGWGLVALTLLAAWTFSDHALMLSQIAACLSAAAATLHIRSFMCVFSQRMKTAFDLGREVERQHQTELRSV